MHRHRRRYFGTGARVPRRHSNQDRHSGGDGGIYPVGTCCDRGVCAPQINSLGYGALAVHRRRAGGLCRRMECQYCQSANSGGGSWFPDVRVGTEFTAEARRDARFRRRLIQQGFAADRSSYRISVISERHRRTACPGADTDIDEYSGPHRRWIELRRFSFLSR